MWEEAFRGVTCQEPVEAGRGSSGALWLGISELE